MNTGRQFGDTKHAVCVGLHSSSVPEIRCNGPCFVPILKFNRKMLSVYAEGENGLIDDTLKPDLALQLPQSPFLNSLSESRLNATLNVIAFA